MYQYKMKNNKKMLIAISLIVLLVLVGLVVYLSTKSCKENMDYVARKHEKPMVVNGYYPLYKKELTSNLVSKLTGGDGKSHQHKFDNLTYYMPNQNNALKLYHGDYKEESS
tara:strand:+ start:2953 stop:3285 length:333 start_codon:yes stop_codon:yes gene_type:complete